MIDRDGQHSSHGSSEQRRVTQSSGVRASHTHVDPEKMSWSQSGLEQAREEETWECIPSSGRGGGEQKCAVRCDKVQSEK